MRDKEYGLVVTPTDAAEGIYKVKAPWNVFKVLNFNDETTGGGYYQGAFIGYERREIIRNRLRKSGILNCETIFELIGSGGGGSGLALEQLRVLLEELTENKWVNVVFVISEKIFSRSMFNTMAALQTLNELLEQYRNLSVTLISNKTFFGLGYRGFQQINADIAKWLVTEVQASLLSQYDVENVISKEDFRFSSVCLKTGVVAKEVTENKHRIEELAKKAMDDIWLSNDEIPVNLREISGIWLLSSVPSKLFNAFAKAKIDVEGMLKEVVSRGFEDGGLKWDDVIKGAMLNDSICEIDGKCFRNKVKEIEVVSRVALNRAMAERRFEELNSCLDRVWEEVACGEGERNPLVRIARTQKVHMEKIRR